MKTITLNNGNTYTQQDNGYCFATIDGKKIRCSTASFKMAYDQFVKEENERQNAANQFMNIDALIAVIDESEKTEEAKEIQKELAPKKARKPRKSKDIAFKTTIALADDRIADVTLTAKQVDFIHHLPDTCFWEEGLDSCVWVDCLCDDIGGQFAGKPMTVGAMISTLCEKDLGTLATRRRENRKCVSFELTELGKRVAAELGLH